MTDPDSSPAYFATASRGTEEVLADELRELGIATVEASRGGVAFGSTIEDAYRACLLSRIASRVVMPLARFSASTAEEFYDGVHALAWHDHLSPARTMAVAVAGSDAPAGPPHFLTLKAKDAIVDRIREATGSRPDVDPKRPDVRVHVHVRGTAVTVSIDLAGRGLHRRGRGRARTAAPLRETLAAALLRIAGWPGEDPSTPLFDPMCGSGTVLLEGAGMALDVAPGLARGAFGARGWLGHDTALWGRLRAEAEDRRRAADGRTLRIAGADAAPSAIAAARENLARAGLGARVTVERRDLADAAPPWNVAGILVTNPPYGERLGEAGELGPLYERLGDVLRRRFPGWTAWVLTGNPALAKRIGLRPARRAPVFNGPIECRFLAFPIEREAVAGEAGPGWRRVGEAAAPFVTRLRRNLRERAKIARREHLTAYRLYDSDVPSFNLAVDWYDGAVRIEEYARPPGVDAGDADRRLQEAIRAVPEVLGIDPRDVVVRVRRRLAPGEQPTRRAETGRFRDVREGDLVFRVNLDDYLDTGLFLDDRLVRRRIRAGVRGGTFLNLFAHTCAATVAAAAGGARATVSVDLSRGYLDRGRDNLAANGFAGREHRLVRADVFRFLESSHERDRFDRILLAPPTRSRSKGMRGDLDVQRDHVRMIALAARKLAPSGELLFTTNFRRFALADDALTDLAAREITDEITPFDFARRPRLRAWSITRRAPA